MPSITRSTAPFVDTFFLQAILKPAFTSLLAIDHSYLVTYVGRLLNVIIALLSLLNGRALDFYNQDIRLTNPSQLLESYEYIVVGGGIAGCLVSKRLADAGHSTLLIHGPGSLPNDLTRVPFFNVLNHGNPDHDWQYKGPVIQKLHWKHHKARYISGKDLGGSHPLSAQVWSYGKRGDFRTWNKLLNISTKFDFDNIRKFGQLHEAADPNIQGTDYDYGYTGEIQIRRSPVWSPFNKLQEIFETTAARVTETRIVSDPNSDTLGFTKVISSVEHRRNTAYTSTPTRAFFEHKVPKKLHILTKHMVTKILFDTTLSPPRAYGVEYVSVKDRKKKLNKIAVKAVILSAGAVRSPQLLILSGIGPESVLRRFNIEPTAIREGVSKNLHDHYDIGKASICFNKPTKGYEDFSFKQLIQFAQNGQGPLAAPFGCQSMGFFRSKFPVLSSCPEPADPDSCQPDFELILQSLGQNTPLAAKHYFADGITQDDLEMFYLSGREKRPRFKLDVYSKQAECLLVTPTLLHPEYRGKITLTSADVFDNPIIDSNPTTNQRDMQLFGELWQMVKNITNEAFNSIDGFFVVDPLPECMKFRDRDSIEFGTCQAIPFMRTAWHMAGTCRLGHRDDPRAVVDEDFNVIGVQNLKLVDGSVIPYPTSGHMLATISALAEMAAQSLIAPPQAEGNE